MLNGSKIPTPKESMLWMQTVYLSVVQTKQEQGKEFWARWFPFLFNAFHMLQP